MGANHDWVTAIARRYERPLVAYVGRLLGDPDRARDVVQEAFLALCRQSESEVGPRVAPWLFAVCRRKAIDITRKETRMTALTATADPPAAGPDPATAAETHDTAAAVLARLGRLPANQQEVVRLKFLHQFSYREIADVTGLTESHVGVLLHTALKSLRTSFAGSKS